MKYPTRGLIGQEGTVNKLFSKLYMTSAAFLTAMFFLSFLFKKIKNFEIRNSEKCSIDVIVIIPKVHVIALTFSILLLVVGFIQLYGVRYIMLEKNNQITKKYQNNIITFYSNFFFFVLFEMFEIIYNSFYISIKQPNCVFHTYYQLIRIFVFGVVRPLSILILLKRNMPEFFTDESQELLNENNRFIIIGNVSPAPRQQSFSQYKPFSQNARWGWQSRRFIQVNEEISNDFRVEEKQLDVTPRPISMSNIDI